MNIRRCDARIAKKKTERVEGMQTCEKKMIAPEHILNVLLTISEGTRKYFFLKKTGYLWYYKL